MIIISIKENESIERALKKYKKKIDKTGVLKQLRERKQYTKPSVKKRNSKQKAIYIRKIQEEEL